MLAQEESLNVAIRFSAHYGCHTAKSILSSAFRKLVRAFIKISAFICGEKYYEQVIDRTWSQRSL